jgi:hypothetical protein
MDQIFIKTPNHIEEDRAASKSLIKNRLFSFDVPAQQAVSSLFINLWCGAESRA